MRLVSVSMLGMDMVLARSVYYRDCLVLRAGQSELVRHADRLHNMGIDYIYVEDRKSEGIEIPDVLTEETRIKCKLALRDVMDQIKSTSVADMDGLNKTVGTVLDEILQNKDVQISLNDIGATDDYTFAHSVSTTVYSLMLASKLNYSKRMLEKLAIGTLLHDIGKILLDGDVLFKEEELALEEYEYVKLHTVLGYEALEKCPSLTELSRIIVLFHHERMDGQGYPRGVKAGELHEFARIVAIADVYDALTSDRCYRGKWSNEKAVNYLIECSGTKFDSDLVHAFIQMIAIYPNGSVVRLSDGRIGIIKEQNKSMPLRPIVRVTNGMDGGEIDWYEIDLLKELSITIIQSELELNSEKVRIEMEV